MTMTKSQFSKTFGIACADLNQAPDAFDAAAMLERLISKRDPIHAAETVIKIMQALEHDYVKEAA